MNGDHQAPSVVLYAPYAIIAPGGYANAISAYSYPSLSNEQYQATEEVMRKRSTFSHRNNFPKSMSFSPQQQRRGWWKSNNRASAKTVPSVSISSVDVDASDATESTPRDGSKVPSLCGDYIKFVNEEERQRRDTGEPSTSGTGASDASGWGSLTVGILQAIFSKSGEWKQPRLVCRHWLAVADNHLETLTPTLMWTRVIIRRFPNLRTLHLSGNCKARNRDLAILSSSAAKRQLQTLTLTDDPEHPWVSNAGLEELAKMSSLTSLSLINCLRVTNVGIQSLSKLQNLSSLSLKGCRNLTSTGLEALKENHALTSLNLYGCVRLANNGLQALQNLRLVSLQLGNTKVRDEGLAHLAHITTLQELHFETESLTDAGIIQLSSLTRLETLALRDCAAVSSDSLSQLVPGLPNLISLDLCKNFTMDDAQLSRCLDFLGHVTSLDLRSTPVTEDGLKQLTRLSSLQKLCLSPTNDNLWSQYLCVVSDLTQLTSLSINNFDMCHLMSFGQLEALNRLTLLRELDLSHDESCSSSSSSRGGAALHDSSSQDNSSDITTSATSGSSPHFEEVVNPKAISAMAAITSLTSIDLSRRSVKEEHLNVLAEKLPKLSTLIIVGCPVLHDGVQSLKRRYPKINLMHRKSAGSIKSETSHGGASCNSSDLNGVL